MRFFNCKPWNARLSRQSVFWHNGLKFFKSLLCQQLTPEYVIYVIIIKVAGFIHARRLVVPNFANISRGASSQEPPLDLFLFRFTQTSIWSTYFQKFHELVKGAWVLIVTDTSGDCRHHVYMDYDTIPRSWVHGASTGGLSAWGRYQDPCSFSLFPIHFFVNQFFHRLSIQVGKPLCAGNL